jgi:hypothetical protein
MAPHLLLKRGDNEPGDAPWRTTAHDLDAELLLRQGALDWWLTRLEIAASILGVIAFAIFCPGADKLLGLLVPALLGSLTLISSSWLAVTADSVVDHGDRGSTPKRVSRTQVASVHRRWTGC